MANPSQNPTHPEDDSWGKIAEDLFGIQFNEVDNDFEFPDDDAPTKAKPPEPERPSPVLAKAEIHPQVEPVETVSESADESDSAKKSVPGNEDHDEFWDILESWNWDEPQNKSAKKEPAKPRRPEETREVRPRQEAATPSHPPRREEGSTREGSVRAEPERTPKGDRRDDRRPERPRRSSSETGDSGPPRSNRNRRGDEQRSRSDQDRPPKRTEGDRSTAERGANRQTSREVLTARLVDDDEFGTGVEESGNTSRPAPAPPSRPMPAASSRPKVDRQPPARKSQRPVASIPLDDFEGDIFVDDVDEEMTDEEFAGEEGEIDEGDSVPGDDQSDRPRRRRRRRRRGRGRGRVSPDTPVQDEADLEDTAELDDEFAEVESEEESSDTASAEDDSEVDEDREARRPRRRRRRRGRKVEPGRSREPEEGSAELEEDDEDPRLDDGGIQEEDSGDEIVVPISYDGIPTWEEAISYLVITPPESRGHQRGRGDGRRR